MRARVLIRCKRHHRLDPLALLRFIARRRPEVKLSAGPGIGFRERATHREVLEVATSARAILIRTARQPTPEHVSLMEDVALAVTAIYGGHIVTALSPA